MNRKILYSLCAFFMMLFLMIAGGNKPGICIIVALASGSVGYFARDFLNKRRHKKLVQSMDMDMPDSSVEYSEVYMEIQALEEKYRVPFVLHYVEGFSLKESSDYEFK